MRILCFGDSNTYGYDPRSYFGGRYPAENRWVDQLAQKTGWEVLNAGQNGREIPHRIYELATVNQQLSAYNALDAFVVMLGYNDLLQGTAVTAIAARMEAFLEQLPPVCRNILLVAPPPLKRGQWVTEDHLLDASFQLAAQYQMLAQKLGIGFADAGRWEVERTFDGVHFSEAGHRAFAEGLYGELAGSREFEL